MIPRNSRGSGMAYFLRKQSNLERRGKVLADVVCGLILLTFSEVYFGLLGGLVAFIILYAAIVAVDYLMPTEDDAHGATIR